ncbi:cytochrome c oxidase-like protein [Thermochaetoides thermophila DSM 1495]|uniref:Cytochrome c oxidase assembly protein COX16, mitochondrial n=1 Tax=Chaetomium thermophilum (strain DSM 1495 / CBS 144.50 / IMI 039719) TaxID=759272 RepID=G0S1Q7_CHATD|nr:cytochrome c oxidase-like protein [Thermochaetoides thermophila DSM 1495]EGS22967.1 cytochrome c oxidase-like protein [Thermochaetoides thermophila DSM 1495]
MAVFTSKKYMSQARSNTWGARYRSAMAKHPFLLFGLPFLTVIIGGSFVLTPATAVRYERYDRKVRQMTREEELGIGKSGRKVDIREEYYRLAYKDLDNWEQKRVKRLPGEPDGTL